MRPRRLITLTTTIAVTFALSCPGLAAAMWTSVNDDMFQVQRVCRNGLVVDLASKLDGPRSIKVWVADSTATDPMTQSLTTSFTIPHSKTTNLPPMHDPAGFSALSLGRGNKFRWMTLKAVGSQVLVGAGAAPQFYPSTVYNCLVDDRFDPFTVGYVWAHTPDPVPTTPTYTYRPDQFWSYNSTLQTNSVAKTGTGTYTVTFPGLASPGGNAQVTAYGSTPRNCKIASWAPSGSAMVLRVLCFAPGGGLADAEFTASYTAGGGSGNRIAFALADQPTNPGPYPTNRTYQYNNFGGAISVSRSSPGRYTVYIPTNSPWGGDSGSFTVTALGSTNGYCKVNEFGAIWGTEYLWVWCFDSNGSFADQQFSVVYVDGMNVLGSNIMSTGYVMMDNEELSMNTVYTPPSWYQTSTTVTQSGTVTVRRATNEIYPGAYDVFLPYQNVGENWSSGADWDGGNVQVSAFRNNEYGVENIRCQVAYWGDSSEPTQGLLGRRVRVYCFTALGARTDSMFTLQFTSQVQS